MYLFLNATHRNSAWFESRSVERVPLAREMAWKTPIQNLAHAPLDQVMVIDSAPVVSANWHYQRLNIDCFGVSDAFNVAHASVHDDGV